MARARVASVIIARMNVESLRRAFEEHEIRRVRVGGFDIDGILRGKYISLEKFWSAADKGFGFCDVIFGWDSGDVLYDNSRVTGWHSGYPDVLARIDLATFRVLPSEPHTAHFVVDFHETNDKPHPACPRSLLKRVIARAETSGYRPKFGSEFEYWIFREPVAELYERNFLEPTPLTPGMFGYSWVRQGEHSDLIGETMDEMSAYGIEIEGMHTETGPGVYESALRYQDALLAADMAALFKTTMKVLCAKRGLSVTFMAKYNENLPGSSGHLHQSLWTQDGSTNLFADAKAPHGLSRIASHYLGGMIALAPELTALYAPTINSYKRYVPGVWAPLSASWGIENRTCAVRVINQPASATRIEYRQTAADINPYIAIATCLAAGLYGIENAVEPPAPSTGDATTPEGAKHLPRSLPEATQLLSQSDIAKQILGEAFVDHYVRTRDWEARQFARAVTSWELKRYFETV